MWSDAVILSFTAASPGDGTPNVKTSHNWLARALARPLQADAGGHWSLQREDLKRAVACLTKTGRRDITRYRHPHDHRSEQGFCELLPCC